MNKKKVLKRSGAFALSTLMAIGSVPISAFADVLAGTTEMGTTIDYQYGSGYFYFSGNNKLSSAFDTEINVYEHTNGPSYGYKIPASNGVKEEDSYVDVYDNGYMVNVNGASVAIDTRIYLWTESTGTKDGGFGVLYYGPNSYNLATNTATGNFALGGPGQYEAVTGDVKTNIHCEFHFYVKGTLDSDNPVEITKQIGTVTLLDLDTNEGWKVESADSYKVYTSADTHITKDGDWYRGTQEEDNTSLTGRIVISFSTSSSNPLTLVYDPNKNYGSQIVASGKKLTYTINGELPYGKTADDLTPDTRYLATYTNTASTAATELWNHVDVAGYDFNGWYTTSDLSGDVYTGVTSMQSSVNLYASYVEQTGTVTVQKIYGDSDNPSTDLSGYTFTLDGIATSGKTVSMTATTNSYGVAVFENVPVGSEYTIAEQAVYGYTTPTAKTRVNVKKNGNTEVTFTNYLKKNIAVLSKYVDTEGNELITNITPAYYKATQTYTTKAQTIYGYYLTATPSNASGTVGEDPITVTYVYDKVATSVAVHYVNESGESLAEEVITGVYKDSYQTEQKDIKNYVFKSVEGKTSGKMDVTNDDVTYTYARKPITVTVNYINHKGEKLADSETISGLAFDTYETTAKEFEEYDLVATPTNATGKMTEDNNVVTYRYTPKVTSVTVVYQSEDGKVLDTKTIDGHVFDTYSTEQESFYGYSFVESTNNTSGEMTVAPITVTYTYALKDAAVTVNHVNASGKAVADSETLAGKVFDDYSTSPVDYIYGYELDKTPANASGTMTEAPITVTYTYKVKEAKVNVAYVDEEGNTLAESTTINGHVWDTYETTAKTVKGYKVKSVTGETAGEMTEDDINVTYVYEKKDTTVTVKYLDENGKEIADTEVINGKYNDEYSVEPETIYGYEKVSVTGAESGNMTEEPITITYVYKLRDTSVTVNYVDDKGNSLADSVTIEGKVFDEYTTDEKSFFGYNLTATPENAAGEMTEDAITVDYVYALKDATVVTKYVDEDGNPIATDTTKLGKYFDEYETSAKEIYGYELVKTSDNAKGTMTDDETVVVYQYALKDTAVVVSYVNEDGTEIADSETIEGKVFDEYTASAKEIYGYELIEAPENETGTMTEDTIKVVYEYALKDAVVTVKHVNEDGTEIADADVINGKVFDEYTASAKDYIYGYELAETPENETGSMTEEETVVTYVYKLKDTSVEVHFVNEDGEDIADSYTIEGKVFDPYVTNEEIGIYGYELIETPENAVGNMTEDTIKVIYEYQRKAAKVNVSYVNINGDEIAEACTIDGKVFDSYEVEIPEQFGYDFVSISDNSKGEMTEEDIDVVITYDLKDAVVVVNHVDENGEKIADTETIDLTFFDEYKTSQKSIYGYMLVKEPENASGIAHADVTEVNYIYTLKPAAVLVEYVDKDTHAELDSEVITGDVFDEYKTEAKNIYGYELDSVSDYAEGNMVEGRIVVTYYYKHLDSSVTVSYVDEDGNKLADSVIIEGKVLDEYKTEAVEIDGYELVGTPENAKGTMTEDSIEVVYTYAAKVAEPEEPSSNDAPETEPSGNDAPEAPTTEAPSEEEPSTQAPATEAPTEAASSAKAPTTAVDTSSNNAANTGAVAAPFGLFAMLSAGVAMMFGKKREER